jgi:phenylacetate-CoA ligase
MTPRLLTRILRNQRALRSHDRWSRRELEAYQAGALRELRDFAFTHSPFYKELHAGLSARPLHELPIVTKAALMDAFDRVVTDRQITRDAVQAHVATMTTAERLFDRYWVASTSGTTGLRGLFLWDEFEWATVLASYARAQDWAGVAAGLTRRVKLAVVSSRTPWHQSAVVGATADSRIVPTLRLDATDPLEQTVAKLNAFRPDVLVAYASMANALAEEQLAGRLSVSPRAVMCASEVLSEQASARITRAFGARPFNVYAATEPAGIASDCERHRMHLYEDLVITEVVDDSGRPVPPGEFGARVLVTVLFSRTLPLIRYEMSDCVRLGRETCPCGRPFALIDGIEGRREDILEFPGAAGVRVRVHPNVFHDVLDLVQADAWQVVQEGDENLRVLLAGQPREREDAEALAKLRRALEEKGVTPSRIGLERVAAIPRSRVGKAPLVRRATAA